MFAIVEYIIEKLYRTGTAENRRDFSAVMSQEILYPCKAAREIEV